MSGFGAGSGINGAGSGSTDCGSGSTEGKFEWTNMHVMLHMKNTGLFSEIVWKKEEVIELPKVK